MPKQIGPAPNGGVIVETDDGRQVVTTPEQAARVAPLGPTTVEPVPGPPMPFPTEGPPPGQKSVDELLNATVGGGEGYKPRTPVTAGLDSAPLPLAPREPGPKPEAAPDKGWQVGPSGQFVRTPGWEKLSDSEKRQVLEQDFPAAREAQATGSAPTAQAEKLRPVSDFVGGSDGPPASSGGAGGPLGMASASMKATVPGVPSFQPSGGGGVSGRGIEKAAQQQQAAIRESAQIGAQKAAAESAYLEQSATEAEKREGERVQREQERAAYVKGEEDKLRALMEDSTKSVGEIDAGRWWNSRDTGQKVLAGISAFLSGFGGGPDMIQNFIQQDIALQRESLANKRANKQQAVANQSTLLGLARSRFSDERAADIAAEAAATNLAQQKLQAILSRTNSAEVLARGKELGAQLEMQKAEKMNQLAQFNASYALQRAGLQLDAMKVGAAMQANAADAKKNGNDRFVPMENMPDGGVMALDKDAAKNLRESEIAYGSVSDKLNRLIELRKQYGGEALPTGAKKTLTSLGAELVGELNKSKKFGALDKGTQEMLERVTGGDVTSFSDILPALMSVKRSIEAERQRAIFVNTGQKLGASSFVAKPEAR